MSRNKDLFHSEIIANGTESLAIEEQDEQLATQFDNYDPCCRIAAKFGYLLGHADKLLEQCERDGKQETQTLGESVKPVLAETVAT